MIVDCHTHLWRTEDWSEEMTREASIARGGPAQVEISEDEHWAAMEPVDRAIVFGFHSKHLGLIVPNDRIKSYVALHPEKLIGFACLDPNEPDYLDEMEKVFLRDGFRGLKLAPIYQNFHVMDDRMYPVYAFCEKHGIPMLVHQGTTFPRRAPLKFAQPIDLEDVALAYPKLKIIVAHMGHPWVEDAVVLIRKQPNVFADISALYYRPWQFYNALMLAQEYGCAHKLLLGSDYPFTTPGDTMTALRNVNHITGNSGLPRIREDVIEGMIDRDTLGLLGIG
jgi:predicted TIM-barrel fold metal-dependent hydrolase